MAGDSNKPLHTTQSTPSKQTDGVVVAVNYAALAKYEVNIRSFHPNKQFEGWGFRFHGDDRAFSLGQSYFDSPGDGNDLVTSRIWQRYYLDTAIPSSSDLTHDQKAGLQTQSNASSSGPGAWSVFGHTEPYQDPKHKPRGKLSAAIVRVPHGGQKEVTMESWYGGENHAFMLSSFVNDHTGWTFVPTLDVFGEVFVRVERVNRYLDIIAIVDGDGFPNCEAYIKDPAGNKLFLGTHVRIGLPATHLAGENHRLMFANAMRIEIDDAGNFKDKVWVFAHVLGGPPAHREDYPTDASSEQCKAVANTMVVEKPLLAFMPKPFTDGFVWDCGNPDLIAQQGSKTTKPLLVSAYTPIDTIRFKLQQTWQSGPAEKTTRSEWNNYHLHRNPNQGRSKDDYDLSDDKWNKQY